MSFSYASVVETARLSARIQRIVLHIDDPAALDVKHAGDSAVGIYFSGGDGGDGESADGRNYSVHRVDEVLPRRLRMGLDDDLR